MPDKEQRIFWLGMHVVLTQTELPRLRTLGYEVFNPPYNSPIYDQSANLDWDRGQHTTLPRAVFDELAAYNFFYNPISPRVADLLNQYFGTVIVTISPDWLRAVLEVYKGRVIYRTYGQHGSLSESLWENGCYRTILERDDFCFVPHAAEVAVQEHAWLKERMEVVPYSLPLDVFDHQDTWNIDAPHEPEIMLTCPNIDNAYFAEHYRYLNRQFPDAFMRLYGVQRRHVPDPRIVGTLARAEMLARYRRSAGYFYTYQAANVCYLPPIEMMTVGGPVVFLPGSLLARYFGKGAPGRASDPEDARRRLRLLLAGDRSYIREVIASQYEVRKRYAPDHAYSIFDRTFPRLLKASEAVRARPPFLESRPTEPGRKRVYVLFHFPGNLIKFQGGEYSCAEGIPRVMNKLVRSILDHTDQDVVVTCRGGQFQEVYGFFRSEEHRERLSFLRVDSGPVAPKRKGRMARLLNRVVAAPNWLRRQTWPLLQRLLFRDRRGRPSRFGLARKFAEAAWAFAVLLFLLPSRVLIEAGVDLWGWWSGKLERRRRRHYVRAINCDRNAACVVIPHYYLFPEAAELTVPAVMYLPDYLPHFVTERFEGNAKRHVRIGQELSRRAAVVLANSEFTRSYLPDCALRVAPEKIQVAPIPLLMPRRQPLEPEREARLRQLVGKSPYLFYPTQNRPNKQIAFLLRLFAQLHSKRPELKLVLTCWLEHVGAAAAAEDGDLESSVVMLPDLTDEELAFLYEHAGALCLTTTMEGNFPPQVFEALTTGTPVVATRLPMITEILGEDSDHLLLCEPLDEADFLAKITRALDVPDEVRAQQKVAHERLLRQAGDARFGEAMASMLRKVAA